MRQAITTTFIGPTDYKGSRCKATAEAGTLTMSWDYRYDSEMNHLLVAQALAEKLGWDGEWRGGGLPYGSGYCFVMVEGDHAFTARGEK
jgi:hypothetical protein